jgi:hypothetical protein
MCMPSSLNGLGPRIEYEVARSLRLIARLAGLGIHTQTMREYLEIK